MVLAAGVRTSLVVLEQIYVRGAVAGVPGSGAGAPRRGALRHAGPGDPGGRRVGAPAAGAGTRERRASRGQGGEGPRSAGARRRARAASAPRPLLEPARGAAATGARRPTGQAAPARADVATPGRRSRRRGDLSSRHPRPVDGSLEASTAGKNASAHSAQALGLADFKNAFSTPLSSRGGPAARPLSARSARSQASSEHRTSRSDDRRPREGHATAHTAGESRAPQATRERRREGRRSRPRLPARAGENSSRGNGGGHRRRGRRPRRDRRTIAAKPRSSDERSALGDGSILPPVRGARRRPGPGASSRRGRPPRRDRRGQRRRRSSARAAGSGPCAGRTSRALAAVTTVRGDLPCLCRRSRRRRNPRLRPAVPSQNLTSRLPRWAPSPSTLATNPRRRRQWRRSRRIRRPRPSTTFLIGPRASRHANVRCRPRPASRRDDDGEMSGSKINRGRNLTSLDPRLRRFVQVRRANRYSLIQMIRILRLS